MLSAMMLAHWAFVDNTGRTLNFKIESPSLFGRGANHYKPTFSSRCASLIFHKFHFHIITYYFHSIFEWGVLLNSINFNFSLLGNLVFTATDNSSGRHFHTFAFASNLLESCAPRCHHFHFNSSQRRF